MKKRILAYRIRIDDCLSGKNPVEDWNKLLEEHLVNISFFQHERLVHLIVTVLFALLTMANFFVLIVSGIIQLTVLLILFLALLIPYIRHYYLLENEVQKMYNQYDEILKRLN